ncbi:hypothetical protein NHX12_014064 [Muraenolepis orangiensis]|uniref:Uncharacterized protein n=1 Tax=Muraenolepis orangiensis TaxID=630683 RepID=A0A9Q0I598_9TELE|nr:hypothetical protein NHX12_014064 [Muraenolepis orangiensis]
MWAQRSETYRQELAEDRAHRWALRSRDIVPYFHPENTQLHRELLWCQEPDMKRLSLALPRLPMPSLP